MKVTWSDHRAGVAVVYGIVVVTMLLALASLAVDLGRVQLAKTELRQAADAAARYAVPGLADGTWQRRAIDSAADNKVDGQALNLVAADVITGNWNAKANPRFGPGRLPVNAVQVNAQRTSARGNPIRLWFASLIGMREFDIQTSATAATVAYPSGFIGLDGFNVKNNMRSAGYDSSTNPTPAWETRTTGGMLGTNVSLTAGNNEVVGFVVLGTSATHNLSLSAPPTVLDVDIPIPSVDFSGAPATNPNGLPKSLKVNSSVTLPGGSYYFTSVDVANSADLRFSGPATIYIDGSVNFAQNNAVYAYRNLPANLRIFIRGTGTVFGGTNANNLTIVADIIAPQTDFNANNNAMLYGAATFRTITVRNNAEFYYDSTLNRTLGVGAVVSLVQ